MAAGRAPFAARDPLAARHESQPRELTGDDYKVI